MRRLLGIVLPAVLLLAAPAAAPAKEVTGGEVCGTDGCRSIASPRITLLEGGPPVSGPAAREPFVRVRLRIGVPGHSEPVRMLFLPRSGLVLAGDGATWMRPGALAELHALARRVAPFPARSLPASAPLAPSVAATAHPGRDDGWKAWWAVGPAALVVLAGGVMIARRRRVATGARAGASPA
jgi:hypothetical protein